MTAPATLSRRPPPLTIPPRVHPLDRPATYDLDRSGMFGHIAGVADELEKAWAEASALRLPALGERVTLIVIAGMGGSATAGDYLAALARDSALPIQVVRGLSLPGSVGPETFVALCSSSGNTEETLALYEDARARDAMILAITRGGELAQRCDRDGSPWWRVRYDSPPRAATVQTLAPLLQLGVRLGACAGDDERIARAAHAHRAFVRRNRTGEGFDTNEAKQLAERLHGRIPIVVAAEHLAPAAVRFKNQLAENGKMLASAETLPEAGHNLVVGLGTAAGLPASLVTLESASLSDRRLRRRFDGLCEQFAETGLPVHRISIDECSPLAELLVATAWGDWVSCYAGLLNGFDPTPIPQIESMRRAAAG